ncbi:xanthine dehydrogenase family protein subunit M [Nocardioides sp. JQ2195]|uniref:FAD binding domain-containing protein n=1 Tax=Nocardioides sp. JQ2195 TaxID=2592334 RepID=UPI00143E169A|nr:FAD binding domain-containing protein [Nocardioides sp. JQ2195]QIX27630.1 xanthine dehydrogenase family protein subunit M [Nocardioides sp. JQ2195]
MKPAPFAYSRPTTLDEALDALASDPHAKVLAGGQSLVPLLSMRLASPSLLVDINGLAELATVRADEDGVRVGALARHAQVETDPGVRRTQPLVARALRLVAHPTIRNRGTTVGSLVHADAAAEMPAVLLLLDGALTVLSGEGEREIPAADLVVGPLESSLRAGELAVSAHFPALQKGFGIACDEVARRHGDYAVCGVAALVGIDESRQVTSARTSYWSMGDVPIAVDLSEAFSAGEPSEDALDAAADLALTRLDPAADIHASAAYRAQLGRVLTRRVLRAAYDDAVARHEEDR